VCVCVCVCVCSCVCVQLCMHLFMCMCISQSALWRMTFLPAKTFLVDVCMLTHIHTSQSICVLWPNIKYKHVCNTHFQSITDIIYGYGRHLFPIDFLFSVSTYQIPVEPNYLLHQLLYIRWPTCKLH